MGGGKVEKSRAHKFGRLYDKYNKRYRKSDIRSDKWLLRFDYHRILAVQRTLLTHSLKLENRGGIPDEEIKGLFQAFKKCAVPWSKAEIINDDKRRCDALDFIFECREKAGMPVEDRGAYDGSRVETAGAFRVMPEIMSGKFSKTKDVEEVKEAGTDVPVAIDGAVSEEVWEGIRDEDGDMEVYEHEEVYVVSPRRD